MRGLQTLWVIALLIYIETNNVECRQTAALIVGGFLDGTGVSDKVELFGCENAPISSFIVDGFPKSVYLAGGLYLDGQVNICGGFQCADNVCSMEKNCYQLNPNNKVWTNDGTQLQNNRYAYKMEMIQNAPVAYGYHYMSEKFENGVWNNYIEGEERLLSPHCNVYDPEDNVLYYVSYHQMRTVNLETG